MTGDFTLHFTINNLSQGNFPLERDKGLEGAVAGLFQEIDHTIDYMAARMNPHRFLVISTEKHQGKDVVRVLSLDIDALRNHILQSAIMGENPKKVSYQEIKTALLKGSVSLQLGNDSVSFRSVQQEEKKSSFFVPNMIPLASKRRDGAEQVEALSLYGFMGTLLGKTHFLYSTSTQENQKGFVKNVGVHANRSSTMDQMCQKMLNTAQQESNTINIPTWATQWKSAFIDAGVVDQDAFDNPENYSEQTQFLVAILDKGSKGKYQNIQQLQEELKDLNLTKGVQDTRY